MLIRAKEGDLAVSRDGVVFEPAVFHGPPIAEVWPWSEVRRITVSKVTRSGDSLDFGLLGILGFFVRRHEVAVTVALPDRDQTWYSRQSFPEVSAAAQRVRDEVAAAAEKIVIEV